MAEDERAISEPPSFDKSSTLRGFSRNSLVDLVAIGRVQPGVTSTGSNGMFEMDDADANYDDDYEDDDDEDCFSDSDSPVAAPPQGLETEKNKASPFSKFQFNRSATTVRDNSASALKQRYRSNRSRNSHSPAVRDASSTDTLNVVDENTLGGQGLPRVSSHHPSPAGLAPTDSSRPLEKDWNEAASIEKFGPLLCPPPPVIVTSIPKESEAPTDTNARRKLPACLRCWMEADGSFSSQVESRALLLWQGVIIGYILYTLALIYLFPSGNLSDEDNSANTSVVLAFAVSEMILGVALLVLKAPLYSNSQTRPKTRWQVAGWIVEVWALFIIVFIALAEAILLTATTELYDGWIWTKKSQLALHFIVLILSAKDWELRSKTRQISLPERRATAIDSPIDRLLHTFSEVERCVSLPKWLLRDIRSAKNIVASGKLYEPPADSINKLGAEESAWARTASVSAADIHDVRSIDLARRLNIPSYSSQSNGLSRRHRVSDVYTTQNSLRLHGGVEDLILHRGLPDEVLGKVLEGVTRHDFDVFEFEKLTDNRSLVLLMEVMLRGCEAFQELKIPRSKWTVFLAAVQDGYKDQIFHNATHAADVTQATFWMLITGGVCDLLSGFSSVELFCCLLAAAIHDYDHPGVTNAFLVNTRSEKAVRYNDQSVLENHHVASVFALTQREEYAIFKKTPNDRYKMVREAVINIVLNTDMSNHFTKLGKLKGIISSGRTPAEWLESAEMPYEERLLLFAQIVHASDVSNVARPLSLHLRWTERIMAEFFQQGAREKALGLTVSPLMDRDTTNIAKAQMGFIDVITLPLFTTLSALFPRCERTWVEHLVLNKAFWVSKVDHMDRQMKARTQHIPPCPIEWGKPGEKKKGACAVNSSTIIRLRSSSACP